MATITRYSTASGDKWEVRYRTPEGKTTRKRGFATKRDAVAFSASTEVSKMTGAYVAPSAGRVTVGTVAARWETGLAGLAATTRASNLSVYRSHVAPRWSDVAVGKVKPSAVKAWVSEIHAAGVGPSTITRAVGVFRQVLAVAVEDGHLAANAAQDVPLPRRQHRARGYLTHGQVEALASRLEATDAALVRFLAYTGLRFGEAAGLVVADVDMLRRRVTVQRSVAEAGGKVVTTPGKTSTRRTVPVPAFLVVELSALMVGRSRDDLLFTGPGGRVLRLSNWRRRVFSPALMAARFDDREFPEVTPHDLRHTAASLAISAGANVKAVQTMLGHSSAAMTLDVYSDLFPDDLEAVAARLDEARSASIGTVRVQTVSKHDEGAASA